MAKTPDGCPECQSSDISTADGIVYSCAECNTTMVKHRRRGRGPFGGESEYFMPLKRRGLEDVQQQPRSGKPHIINTED